MEENIGKFTSLYSLSGRDIREFILNIIKTSSHKSIPITYLIDIVKAFYPQLTGSQIKAEVYPLISSGKLRLDSNLDILTVIYP